MRSNIPKDYVERQLLSIISLYNLQEFLDKSKDLGLLKNIKEICG